MKYYLIKAEETSNGLIETLGELEKNKVVELTEDWMQTLVDLTTTRLPNALNDSLRKVLE